MKTATLHAAMMNLSGRYDLNPDYNALSDMPVGDETQIEAVAHELAHALCLGRPMSTDALGDRLSRMSVAKADAHELTTLRIEVAALAKLGHEVDGDHLFITASFRGKRPAEKAFNAPLTVAEQAVASWLVSIVKAAAQERKP